MFEAEKYKKKEIKKIAIKSDLLSLQNIFWLMAFIFISREL